MSRLTTQSKTKASHLNIKFTKEKGEVKEGLIILTEVVSKEELGHINETDSKDPLIYVDLSMEKHSEGKLQERKQQRRG